jgi:hypothetical protein
MAIATLTFEPIDMIERSRIPFHGISKNSLFEDFPVHIWLIFEDLVVNKVNF